MFFLGGGGGYVNRGVMYWFGLILSKILFFSSWGSEHAHAILDIGSTSVGTRDLIK